MSGDGWIRLASLTNNTSGRSQSLRGRKNVRARTVNLIDEEVQARVALAELRRRQGDFGAARAFLDEVWEAAERGPFPLFHADALNILAQIEREAGHRDAAATNAYRLAWCDGPPYAYSWGLDAAQRHLAALGAAVPKLPPLDETRHVPMPIRRHRWHE